MTKSKRNCYCDLWDTDATLLEKQGVLRGYCGICDICNNQGHLSHAPGCHPYTASWCNACFRVQSYINYSQCLAIPIFIALLVLKKYYFIPVPVLMFVVPIYINSKGANIIRRLAGT